MMTISNTLETSTAPLAHAATSSAGTGSTSSTDTADFNNLASEDTFLKLFVAQLQNQDPLDPNEQDPTQMVSELAQFSQLEQLVNIGQNVQSIDQTVTGSNASGGSSSGGVSGSNGSANGNAVSNQAA
jgi:flagellar basal-body rod modification protein FlgD